MAKFWQRLEVPFARHFDEVLDKADLYVCDNSSTLYEFASTNRPVLVLNAPWYRRNVHHGLRFWDAIPGLPVDSPDNLRRGIEMALTDGPFARDERRKAVRYVYGDLCDGQATTRAVSAILDLLHASEPA